jgi:hypothetical protein
MSRYRETGATAYLPMTPPAMNRKSVWRVMGTGMKGIEIHEPAARNAEKAPVLAIKSARCLRTFIVNQK